MRLLERIAHAGVAGGEDAIALAAFAGRIEFQIHQLVHVLHGEHVAVELDDAVVLFERKGRQLAPAVVEARVVGKVLFDLGQQILDMFLGDAAVVEGLVAFGGEGIRVEGDERVLGAVLLQAVVEGEQARQVRRVGDEGRPDWNCGYLNSFQSSASGAYCTFVRLHVIGPLEHAHHVACMFCDASMRLARGISN